MNTQRQLAAIMFTDIVGYTAAKVGKLIRNDMKGLLITLLIFGFLIVLSSCEKEEPNPVVTIPDSNFLSALIDLGVDANGDGIISPEEAEAIISLDVQGDSISDMTGIEAFVNLEHLDCSENQLSTLNVSNNTALTELGISGNQLTSLDVSNNTALTELSCGFNQLTSIDVSNNTALQWLVLWNNQLSILDVSNNTALKLLNLTNNQLSSLDVSNNTALIGLSLWGNQLNSLDVSNNTALDNLNCGFNQLTNLNISNNTALVSIGIHDMPSINEVCVWEMPFPPDGVGVDMTNSPNVFFTTDCTSGD